MGNRAAARRAESAARLRARRLDALADAVWGGRPKRAHALMERLEVSPPPLAEWLGMARNAQIALFLRVMRAEYRQMPPPPS